MPFFSWLSEWSTQRSSWLVLFATSFGLIAAALTFQHIYQHAPCVMCIYQRNAVLGLVLAGMLVLVVNNSVVRAVGYAIWGLSSGWGLKLAWEHYGILTAEGLFFSPCEIAPRFPSFLPLDEWLPSVFAATGFCEDRSWVFLGWNMPHWMVLIFSLYLLAFIVVLSARLFVAKRP